MAFDKEEFQQFEAILDRKLAEQRSAIMLDVQSLLRQELQPIKDDLALLKQEIREVKKMAVEDVEQAFSLIETLKKKVKQLERRVAVLEQ